MHGESALVDITSENIQNELRKIEELLRPYDPVDIMNFGKDVIDLFFKYRNRIVDIINNSKHGIFLENKVIEIIGHFHMLFLVPRQSSDIQKSIFSEVLLNELHNNQVRYFMMKTLKPAGDIYLKLSNIVYDIEEENISIMKGVLMLTQLADTASYYEQRLLIGLARLIEELPKTRVKNNQIGEIELWSSYFHPLLSRILSDNERSVILRWPDKAALEQSQGRPDAIISEVTGNGFGISFGFGECKTSDGCTNASLCKDIIKLAQLSQRSININSVKSVLCFQIYGFEIVFYIANLSNEGVYTFSQLAMVEFPRSVEELPKFVNMKTISQLLRVSQCFWNHCNTQEQCPNLKSKMVQEVDYSALDSFICNKYSVARPCPIKFASL
ncbi:hypothetical protein G6F43_008808 [Rhizopus delemar]|nr:hypothetical protein G6F43_008808 [Rhizopus delemar]